MYCAGCEAANLSVRKSVLADRRNPEPQRG